MATKRKTITKKTRFEVFKRDGFKCQYCGACAPEAILVVDHVHPVSKDGENSMLNYITACQPCNAGKSDRTLDDTSAVQKQRAQLDALHERREQLEMMLAWRDGLNEIQQEQVDAFVNAWEAAAVGWSLNEKGVKEARSYVKKYGLPSCLDAIDTSRDSYMVAGENGKITAESVSNAWKKIGGILRLNSLPDDERRLYYVKGILRNRLSYIPYDVMADISRAARAGVDVDDMIEEAKFTRNWTSYRQWLINAAEGR